MSFEHTSIAPRLGLGRGHPLLPTPGRPLDPAGEDPQDVAQEAAMRAWRMRHQCHDPARPWPWLARICQREAARLAARRRTSPLPDGLEPAEPSAADEMVDRLAVTAAVAELAPIDRELISRRYGEDQTTRWIAGALSMPEGTVKVRLHRARRHLERILQSEA